MVYDYVLDKHTNDCVPIVKSIGGKDAVFVIEVNNVALKSPEIRFAWNKDGQTYDEPASAEELQIAIKKLRECKKRFVPLPFLFHSFKGMKHDFGHLNMIIIDLQSNTAEHLEPHGEQFGRLKYDDNDKSVQGLKYIIDKRLPALFKEWGFTYKNPNESCPYDMGVQTIEGRKDADSKISRVVELDAYNNFAGKQGGLCALWSYILLDLRLSNPDYTIAEIMKQVLKAKSLKDFEAEVLEDYAKSMNSFETLAKLTPEDKKNYTDYLYTKWKEEEALKLSDIFFMYAITYAHEAFSKNSFQLVKFMVQEAEKQQIDNMLDFLSNSNLNPFKLMWYFDNVKNKPINLVYMEKDGKIKSGKNKGEWKYKKKKLNNPNGLHTYAFFRNVENRMKDLMFDRLLNKSSIRVLKEEPKPEPKKPKPKKPKPEPKPITYDTLIEEIKNLDRIARLSGENEEWKKTKREDFVVVKERITMFKNKIDKSGGEDLLNQYNKAWKMAKKRKEW